MRRCETSGGLLACGNRRLVSGQCGGETHLPPPDPTGSERGRVADPRLSFMCAATVNPQPGSGLSAQAGLYWD